MFHFNFYAKKSTITLSFLSFFRCWFLPFFLLYRKQKERNGPWRFSRWRTTHICSTRRPNRIHNRTWTEQPQWNRGYWYCMVSCWLQLWRKRWQNRITGVPWKWLGASKNNDYNHNHNNDRKDHNNNSQTHNQSRNRKRTRRQRYRNRTRRQRSKFGTRSSWTLDSFDAL